MSVVDVRLLLDANWAGRSPRWANAAKVNRLDGDRGKGVLESTDSILRLSAEPGPYVTTCQYHDRMLISASASPAVLGVPVAVLALAVSLLSFAVALGALGWQIAKHRLDGGRPKVYLNVAVWEPNSKIMVNRSGKWELNTTDLGESGSENIELAQLVVENPGRTAITVYSPGLSVVGTEKPAYSISPRAFEARGFGADSSTSDTSVRIDPYDRVTFLLDYWSVVPRLLREAKGGAIRLRGCISVAGRSKPCLSNKRLAWHIHPGAWTARRDIQEISPFTVIWRELFKANVKKHSSEEEAEGDAARPLLLGQ